MKGLLQVQVKLISRKVRGTTRSEIVPTSFSVGLPRLVCAYFVCALSVLSIVFEYYFQSPKLRFVRHYAITRLHVYTSSRMRVKDMTAICD